MNPTGLNRRSFSLAAAFSVAALTPAAAQAQTRLEKTRIAIAVPGRSSFQHLALTLADQLGFFRAEGLEVSLHDLGVGSPAVQAPAGAAPDVVSGPYVQTIRLQAQGQKFQAFVLQGRTPAVAMGVSSRTLRHYRLPAQLRGRRIGIAAVGSAGQMLANVMLARAGLTEADVNFVVLGSSSTALSALRSGQIDAISYGEPVISSLERKGEVRLIADTRTLKGTLDLFGTQMPGACLYAALDFVKKNPNTVQALTHAMVRSLKWLQTASLGDIVRVVPESYLLGNRVRYLETFNKVHESISPDGLFPEDGAQTTLKVLARFDPTIRADRIDLGLTYSNVFATKARERSPT
jgi:NitT/TauT family transport system substrate-binding protein